MSMKFAKALEGLEGVIDQKKGRAWEMFGFESDFRNEESADSFAVEFGDVEVAIVALAFDGNEQGAFYAGEFSAIQKNFMNKEAFFA